MRGPLWVLVLFALLSMTARAAEYQRDEAIAPESAEEVDSPMRDAIPEKRKRRRQMLGKRLETAPAFWRDSKIDLGMRFYDFEREVDDTILSEALTGGGELSFTSGRWRERISIGASWYGSFAIDAPQNKDGTRLLGPGQSDLSVLGKAYANLHFGNITARLYRQDFALPYLNRQDSRMIPNTHEGYVFTRTESKLNFIVGHISKMKERDSEDFVPMAEIAGVDGDHTGTHVAGAQYVFNDSFDVGALVLNTSDVFQTSYVEGSWRRSLSEYWALQLGIQGTDQRSIGAHQLGRFQTQILGMRAIWSYRNAVLTVAYTTTDAGAAIRKPYGGSPSFNSLMLFDFDRASEDAWRIGLSQNFKRFGLPGVGLQLSYARGRNARTNDDTPLSDEREFDITADFRPPEGMLKGFWLRVRYARGDRGHGAADRRDFRLILNYDLGL